MAFAERDDFRENRREARFDIFFFASRAPRRRVVARVVVVVVVVVVAERRERTRALVRQRFFFFVFPRFESFAGDGEQNGRGLGGDEDDSRVRVGGERVVKRAEKRPGAQRRRSGGKPRRVLRIVLFAAGTPLHLGERPAPLRSGPGSRGRERIRVLGNGPGEVRAVRVPGDGDVHVHRARRNDVPRVVAARRKRRLLLFRLFLRILLRLRRAEERPLERLRGRFPRGRVRARLALEPGEVRHHALARARVHATHRLAQGFALAGAELGKVPNLAHERVLHRAVRLPRRLLSLQGLARGHARAERAPRLRFRLCARVPPPGAPAHERRRGPRHDGRCQRRKKRSLDSEELGSPRCRPRARVSPLEAVACDAPLRARRRATTREQTSPPSLTRAPVVFGASAEPRKTAPECFH